MSLARKAPHPWLFALTAIPYGVGGAFTSQLMPSFAEDAGYHLDKIGWFTTLLFVPTWLQFMYTPIVDFGPSRRRWLIALALVGAACFGIACAIPLRTHITAFLVLAFTGQVISGLVGSCNGALMATTIPDEHRGTAGAAYNIGNISGGAVVVFVLIWLHEMLEPWALALITVALMVGPSLAVLAIVEPARERPTEVFTPMLRDVRKVLLSKSGLTGILLMISPVGTAALTNSFTGMKADYHTSAFSAGLVNGVVAAALSALGAWIGGWICDRQSRRAMYLLSGVLTAIVALVIATQAHTREVYIVGVSAYNFVTGFCFAAFTATVLETIGHGDAAAGTKYTLCTAAGNVAIAYVNFIDTRAYGHWHNSTAALFNCDALLNIGGAVVLAFVFWQLGSFGASKHPAEPGIDTASTAPPEPVQLPVARVHDGGSND
jgi:MFS transporter, PAT family, beta-lactamase induction signal transducer AmpG